MPYPSTKDVAERLLSLHNGVRSSKDPKIVLLDSKAILGLAGRKLLRGSVLAAVQRALERERMYLFNSRGVYLLVPFGAPTAMSATARAVRKVIGTYK